MAVDVSSADPIPGVETPAPTTRRRRKPATKAVSAAKSSQYVVQVWQAVETAGGETLEAWEDYDEVSARGGAEACRKTHNARANLPEGEYRYRAFPLRSDIRLTATVEVKPVSLFAVTNGSTPAR